jgi:hypothetical protein
VAFQAPNVATDVRFGPTPMYSHQAMRAVRLGVAASQGDGGPAQSCLGGKLNDAATRLDPLDRAWRQDVG